MTFSVVSSGPVAVPHHHGRVVLKLGKGSITLSPGSSGTVTLRLSSQARAVLKKYGKIKAKVSFVAIDQLGEAHRGSFLITIRRLVLAAPAPDDPGAGGTAADACEVGNNFDSGS